MTTIKNTSELPFTAEQLDYFKSEIKKYRVPCIYKAVYGSLYKWGRFFMPILFLIILALGIVHISTNLDLWNIIKGFAFLWIFFIGISVFTAWIAHRIKVLRSCKKIGLTLKQWNLLVIKYQITYI